jgi:hypothetical protein
MKSKKSPRLVKSAASLTLSQDILQALAALVASQPTALAAVPAVSQPAPTVKLPQRATFVLPKHADGKLTRSKRTGREKYVVAVGSLVSTDGLQCKAYLTVYPSK